MEFHTKTTTTLPNFKEPPISSYKKEKLWQRTLMLVRANILKVNTRFHVGIDVSSAKNAAINEGPGEKNINIYIN